jgi:hypothetical protein
VTSGRFPTAAAPEAPVQEHTVRLVWTGDHVDAARRLQDLVEQPARTAAQASNAGFQLPTWLRPGSAADEAGSGVRREDAPGTGEPVQG